VVNNRSTDRTAAIVKDYSRRPLVARWLHDLTVQRPARFTGWKSWA